MLSTEEHQAEGYHESSTKSVESLCVQGRAFESNRIRDLHAIVIGAGALGSEVVRILCLRGIGRLTVVDPDVVEARNLATSFLFNELGTIGRRKVDVLAEAVNCRFPGTTVCPVPKEVADTATGLLAEGKLWFGCVDSEWARLEMAYLASRLGVPIADAGLGGANHSQGRVSWFAVEDACFSCGLPARRRKEFLSIWNTATSPCGAPPEPSSAFTTPSMASIIGGLQVDVGLGCMFTGKSRSFTIELSAFPQLHTNFIAHSRSEACPFHWPHEGTTTRLVDDKIKVNGLLGDLQCAADSIPSVVLDWPVCVQAACRRCGHLWSPMRRLALFRRRSVCPQCGASAILELKSIRTIERAGEWSSLSFAAFGVPDHSLITVRYGRRQ
jgi:hypothetical protein